MYVELEIFSQDIIINQIPTTSNPTIVEFFLNNYIKLNWKGNWVAGQYLVNDSVRYNGAVWAAKKNTTDTPSLSSEDWSLMVIDGEDGIGVTNIELIETIDLVDHYRMNFSDDSYFDYFLKNGEKGDTGVGVFNIQEAIPLPGVHVIRITLTDNRWYEFTIIDGKDGENGKNPEFRITDTHIQWKLVNEISWINLIALEALRGPTGKNVELSKNSTNLLWRLVGDTEWQTLIALSLITGPAGKSAYEQAQEGGYTGTLQEFISFLNGSYSDINHNHDTKYEQKNSNIQSHISSISNPHSTTKSQVGLGNVDNTSDADKPLSNAEITALSGKVDKETGKGLSQENFTTAEKSKLASLEPSLWLGEYPSLLALQTAHPTGVAGNSAYVDLGAGSPVATYAWDTSDQAWVKQQGDTTAETPESIKQKYESNPDTNAYTDAEKTKLGGISSGADVTKDVLNNSTADNIIEDASSFNFIKLIVGVPTLVKSTYAYLKSYLKTYFDTLYPAIATVLKLDQTIKQTVTASPIINNLTSTRIPFINTDKSLTDAAEMFWYAVQKRLVLGSNVYASDPFRFIISDTNCFGLGINIPAPTSATTGLAIGVSVNNDTYLRTLFYSNGILGFGPGYAPGDVFLGRTASGKLGVFGEYNNYETNADFEVSGNITAENLSGTNTGDQDLSGLQIKNLKFTNVAANSWATDTPTYTGYTYKCELTLTGVTSTDIAEVIFGHTEAISGNYSPISLTGAGIVTIYSKVNTTITIPTILINK